MTTIHPTAIIEPGAQLDASVEIGAFAYIGANVILHKGTKVSHHALVEGRTTLGEETQVYPFAKVGITPQDLKFKGEPSRLILGARNKVREGASIEIGTEGGGMVTRLGNDNLIMMNAHIGHDSQLGDDVIVGMCSGTAGHVVVGSGVRIASLVAIHQFVMLGECAFIGLSSIINRNLLPYSMVNNYSLLRGVNRLGMRRQGIENSVIAEVQSVHDHVYQKGETMAWRMETLATRHFTSKEAQVTQNFALQQQQSKQGLMPLSDRE